MRNRPILANALALAAAGAGIPAETAIGSPTERRESLVEAQVKTSSTGDAIVAHGPARTLTFAFVPGTEGKEMLVRLGPTIACRGDVDDPSAENPEFWRSYYRLAERVPPLHVRYDPSADRFVALNRTQVIRARRRITQGALSLLDLCYFENDAEREVARQSVGRGQRERFDLDEAGWFGILKPIILGVQSTRGLTRFHADTMIEGPCRAILGRRLAMIPPYDASAYCLARSRSPDAGSDSEEMGSYSVVARGSMPDSSVTILTVVYRHFTFPAVPDFPQ